ncbi:pyruvate dehydrogenase [acetyl-transferring]-phosphatase 1, mitochondrial [Aplysia californica]|uniref:Pyruvate dehydrogenase [acetyl-transferring]-phosphatase 1, mitochondrial n=1 Tax=Aplysia californica TaxID=6500 RepID=A0ABM0K335_APLCA|nr:pyruvate dehydrogenase [acetyl-transferring]-phosphatase 1, mitochondrial [Aplysia californica]
MMLNSAKRAISSSSVKHLRRSNLLRQDSRENDLPVGLQSIPGHGRCHSFMQLFHKLRLAQGPDPVESPRLTPQMVTSILRMNEQSSQGTTRGIVREIQCNQLQANKPIEDRHVEAKLAGTDKYLFGVFDGHAGCACAQALKDRLFQYIAVSMSDPSRLNQLYQEEMGATAQLLEYLPTASVDPVSPDLATIHWQSLHNFINDCLDMYSLDSTVEESLVNAFLRLDQDISLEASFHPGDMGLSADLVNIAFSGAVGCVAYIDGLDLYVANVGDSQAVIGSHSTESETWHATPVSLKHDAENTGEVKRLFAKHPNESHNILKGGRLFGELMPLRAFGDVRYKWGKKDLIHLKNLAGQSSGPFLPSYKNITIPNNYRTPPYLDAEPEVIHYRLSPKDRFLILASDGLWDSDGLSVEKVVSLVGHHTEGQQVLTHFRPAEATPLGAINESLRKRKQNLAKRALDDNVATHLMRHALGLEHGQLSAQLTLPQKLVRYYRDDITITVVYFDSDYIMDYTRQH